MDQDQKTLTPEQQEAVCDFLRRFEDSVKVLDEVFHDSLFAADKGTAGSSDWRWRYYNVAELKRLIVKLDPEQGEYM